MARINAQIMSARKVFDFTYQTPQETLLGTPQTLPTSEPATPQVSYTVASGDLPSVSIPLAGNKWIGMVIGAGQFVTAGTLSWRMKKNGASVNTGTLSVSANYYYTVQAWFYDVSVGDVLEIALWSSVADSKYDYKAYQIHITRITFYNKPLSNLKIDSIVAQPVLTLGNPAAPTANWYIYVIHKDYNFTPDATSYYYRSASAGDTFRILYPDPTYGTMYTKNGDVSSQNAVTTQTHASQRPRYSRNYLPSKITLRYLTPREI